MSPNTLWLDTPLPEHIDVGGIETQPGITCIGQATHVGGLNYRCLANVMGMLALVEITLVERGSGDD